MKHLGFLRIIGVVLLLSTQPQIYSQDASSIKAQLCKFRAGQKITIRTFANAQHGRFVSIAGPDLLINEVDLHATVKIPLTNIVEVLHGYGGKSALTGKRQDKNHNVAFVIGAVAALFVVAILAGKS